MTADILVKNGMVMDGTGRPSFRADVIIEGDRIKDVGLFPDAEAAHEIDAQGLVVAPGLIDVHTHLGFFLPSKRHPEVLKSWIYQGVTTVVAGNCGYSSAPINHDCEDIINKYWSFALPRDGLKYEWTTMGNYFDYL
ncbi:MAG: amidohydrolase family protein, partial [Deltaproteobacteria bacterium]|nr:amidohydrolase family protein [Deltaproteobacteria bacterium]